MADPVPRRDILVGDLRLAFTPFTAGCAVEAPKLVPDIAPRR
jgi:hypothetical protein